MTKPRKKPKARKCPVCERAVTEEFKPFCSKRCADTDLVRWLKGAYAIPGERVEPEETDADPDGPSKPQ